MRNLPATAVMLLACGCASVPSVREADEEAQNVCAVLTDGPDGCVSRFSGIFQSHSDGLLDLVRTAREQCADADIPPKTEAMDSCIANRTQGLREAEVESRETWANTLGVLILLRATQPRTTQ